MSFKLSEKYADFLSHDDSTLEVLEGTTASGKTTVGVLKFMMLVRDSSKALHIISGQNLGVIEKNIINCELGVLDIFGDAVEYFPRGKGSHNLPHIRMKGKGGHEKVVYVLGYDNELRWKYVLGGQYGCVFIDEINIANMNYVRQVVMRCDYMIGTLNPDDPDRPIYKEYINRCRPLEKYARETPKPFIDELTEPHVKGWTWWYFTFDDNPGIDEKRKAKIRRVHAEGTYDHRRYILGLRGKSEGVVFDNFERSRHVIPLSEAINVKNGKDGETFAIYSSGLDTSYSKNTDDTIAMSLIGITTKGRVFVLDEEVLNNKGKSVTFAPSDVVVKYEAFLERGRARFGFSKDNFIDSADQATITEARKHKRNTGSIYNFIPAHKALKIIDRIQLQKGWFALDEMVICENCTEYIRELLTYSWTTKSEKVEPEDANDHMINSVQYAWLPHRLKIGGSSD